jgi:hypothetical protein
VSPTVNINLDGRRDSSTSVHASQLPANQIRAFVEQNVLPKFTRILLQPGCSNGSSSSDNTAADVHGINSSKSSSSKKKCSATAAASYKQQQRDPVNSGAVHTSSNSSSKVLSSSSKQQQGPEFDDWLRTLLHDMQKSIETHIAMVFEARTAAAVAVRT